MSRARKAQIRAALYSFLRVLGACAATAYTAIGKAQVLDWTGHDVKVFGSAILSALVLTGVNALRTGEPRFGRGATETGTLEPPAEQPEDPSGNVRVVEPEPDVVPDVTVDPADLAAPDGPGD